MPILPVELPEAIDIDEQQGQRRTVGLGRGLYASAQPASIDLVESILELRR
jgi:hypothetical protein